MTAEQEIKRQLLKNSVIMGDTILAEEITEENVDTLYEELVAADLHWDLLSEFRCSGENTGLPVPYSPLSRHYESESVGLKLDNGVWVGWTYWHGGGKHSEPDAIDWMDEAYFLCVATTTKMVEVHTFSKVVDGKIVEVPA